jgi:hypothetical protein
MQNAVTITRLSDAENAFVTDHFAERCRQRRVPAEAVALALCHGRQFHEGLDTVHFLGRRELQQWDNERSDWGGVVVVRAGNVLKTTFRNPDFLRKLKRRRWGAPRDVRHEKGRQERRRRHSA